MIKNISKVLTLLFSNGNSFLLRLYGLLGLTQTKTPKQGVNLRRFQAAATKIPGMISFQAAEVLFYLSSTSPLKGDIVEIGSWMGRSTVHLALGCKVSKNGLVHAVDTFKGNPGKEDLYHSPLEGGESIYQRFNKHLKLFKVRRFVRPHRGTSQKAAKEIKTKLRLIFIDGCHDYEAVKLDIKLWKDKLLKNGLLVFDDYSDNFPGVIKAVKEDIINSKKFKILFVSHELLVAKKVR